MKRSIGLILALLFAVGVYGLALITLLNTFKVGG